MSTLNVSSQFEIELLSREIDKCNDVEVLRCKLKEMIQLYYQHKQVTKELLLQK